MKSASIKRRIKKNLLHRPAKFIRKLAHKKTFKDHIEETLKNWWGKKSNKYCSNNLSVCIDRLFMLDQDNWQCCPYWQRKLTNKLNGREFAIKYGVPVPELYWYGKNVDDIPFARLPSSYVIKTSFGTSSKEVLVMINGVNMLNNISLTTNEIREFFRETLLRVSPYGYLIVEELLVSSTNNSIIPKDYKCHVFDGIVKIIHVIDRSLDEEMSYTPEWNVMNDMAGKKFRESKYENRPAECTNLIRFAETLGKAYGHEYVRIDFYLTDKGCVFGEFTATPSGGGDLSTNASRIYSNLWKQMLKPD